jgi:prevent-host-death family protein
MDKVAQASEANRQFSRVLREIAEGNSFAVTAHGRPIARIVPADAKRGEAAKQRFLDCLQRQPGVEMRPFNREELYDC